MTFLKTTRAGTLDIGVWGDCSIECCSILLIPFYEATALTGRIVIEVELYSVDIMSHCSQNFCHWDRLQILRNISTKQLAQSFLPDQGSGMITQLLNARHALGPVPHNPGHCKQTESC